MSIRFEQIFPFLSLTLFTLHLLICLTRRDVGLLEPFGSFRLMPTPVFIQYKPKTANETTRAIKCYEKQKKLEKPTRREDMETVLKFNSHVLPKIDLGNVEELCEKKKKCLQPFVKIHPLITTSPKRKLATCLVQKTMSTVLSSLMCYLDQPNVFLAAGRNLLYEHSEIRFCSGQNEFSSIAKMQKKLRITGRELFDWTFLMMTREPVDRFLSGFIHQCIREGHPCYGCGSNMTCFLERELARATRFSSSGEPRVSNVDIHIYPQNWRCELETYVDKYKLLQYSNNRTNMINQLVHVLRTHHVPEENLIYISKTLESGRTIHATIESPARKFLEKRLRSSSYLIQMIIRMFYFDFKLLHYDLPVGETRGD